MSSFNYPKLFAPTSVIPGQTEETSREEKDFQKTLSNLQTYSGITNYLKNEYERFEKEEKEKTPLREKAKSFESRFANREITDSDQEASALEIRNRLLRGQGKMIFRDYQTGSLLFGNPSQNEMQWLMGRSRDTRSGILAPEKTTWGQIAQRMLAKDLVDEAFFMRHEKENVFSSPETRRKIVPTLENMAKYGQYGAGASWVQYAPFVDPEDRYTLGEELLSVTGYKATHEFLRNYFGTDPVDLTQTVEPPIGWDSMKAWKLYKQDYPETAAWFESNGLNPEEYLANTRDDFHFFEKLGDFIDNNAFRRTTEADIQIMGSTEYAWRTTVMPLIRDSFASSDAPIDLAVTALLSSASFGTAGVGYLSVRGSLLASKIGLNVERSAKLVKAATVFKQVADKTISWLPHNIPGKMLWTPGKSLASRVGHYSSSAVGVGIVTGAWYNIVNQIQNANSDSSYRFSGVNLYHDVLMEIIGEFGLGGLGVAGSKAVGGITTGINTLSGNNVGKLAKKALDSLPPILKDTLLASASVMNPPKNIADMSKYELQRHVDAVMLWYQLKSVGILGDGKQNNTLSIGAWGIASGLLGPEASKTIVDKANKEFDSKKDALQLTEDDRDLFISQMLINSIASKGIDISGFSELLNKIRLEKFLGLKQQELNETNKEKQEERLTRISELQDIIIKLEEELNDPNIDENIRDNIERNLDSWKRELDGLETEVASDNIGKLFSNEEEQLKAFQEFKENQENRVKELLKLLVGDKVVNSNLQIINPDEAQDVQELELNEINDALENSDIPDSGLPMDAAQQVSNQLTDAAIANQNNKQNTTPATPEVPATTTVSSQRDLTEEEIKTIDSAVPDQNAPMQDTSILGYINRGISKNLLKRSFFYLFKGKEYLVIPTDKSTSRQLGQLDFSFSSLQEATDFRNTVKQKSKSNNEEDGFKTLQILETTQPNGTKTYMVTWGEIEAIDEFVDFLNNQPSTQEDFATRWQRLGELFGYSEEAIKAFIAKNLPTNANPAAVTEATPTATPATTTESTELTTKELDAGQPTKTKETPTSIINEHIKSLDQAKALDAVLDEFNGPCE